MESQNYLAKEIIEPETVLEKLITDIKINLSRTDYYAFQKFTMKFQTAWDRIINRLSIRGDANSFRISRVNTRKVRDPSKRNADKIISNR